MKKNLILIVGPAGTTRDCIEYAQEIIIKYFGTKSTNKHDTLPIVYCYNEISFTDFNYLSDNISSDLNLFVICNYDSNQIKDSFIFLEEPKEENEENK